MKKSNRLKRKSLTLIELLVALGLLSLILGQGMYLVMQQVKSKNHYDRFVERFFNKQKLFTEIQSKFCHLLANETGCLVSEKEKIVLLFDAGITLDPYLSGPLTGELSLKNDKLVFVYMRHNKPYQEQVLAHDVLNFEIKFFSQEFLWQDSWNSQSMGLPEMMHLKMKTKQFSIDQPSLLPFSLKPIQVICKSSPSSSR